MRIGGLVSGMDIDSLVGDLMKAERIPMQKMEQDQTWMTWQRDAYREMNTKLSEFQNLFSDMKLSSTYESKITSSSQSDAVTATAGPQAQDGSYSVEVSALASKATNVSQGGISADGEKIDPSKALKDQPFKNNLVTGPLEFSYFNEAGEQAVSVTVNDTDTLNDVFGKINEASDGAVRGFYDANSDKVFLERTDSGNFNDGDMFLGAEIGFNGGTASGFFTDTLNIKNGTQQPDGSWVKNEVGGTDATFKYNGIEMTSKSNSYDLGGVKLQFTNTTNGAATINVQNDDDALMDKITAFVDKYNEVIETVTEKTSEERFRDYPPLTKEQREEMSESEIELWEEKSQSGTLRNDQILARGLSGMRTAWYSDVNTGDPNFNLLADLGITTSSNYRDNGKLEIDPAKLREEIQNDPGKVKEILSNSSEGDSRGLINRVEDQLKNVMSRITDKAGNEFRTGQQYTMGRQLESMEDRIGDFERRLQQTENRYWDQFTQMEKAIQRMNQQSSYMMQQFGGGGQ
ncbi:hypothetical protein CEY16_08705 [Halalkalibacillus sediminis]|uniref:Flagellar hook-associated protein 2 n=2 Tax=Halalkalibacillus sediminis TaxID=2018042 RepID=A0A2I0QV56_9BACI|nr:hypothetical protein CEY16_08705 [Halalkalibacillus sediminis]